MSMNILTLASGLSDHDLLARLGVLAGKEREATVELVAHLAVLDARPALYAAHGFGSLFGYCTEALLLSEDATCNRIYAARACRRFPVILDALASGALSLTSVRLLNPLLTTENHESVLARAKGRKRRDIEALVAELAPRPDVPSTVRKLPSPAPARGTSSSPAPGPQLLDAGPPALAAVPTPPSRRPIIETTSPERYRVQFTIGPESHDTLRRLQDLLRREIPSGDPGVIVERALALLLEKVEKAKRGATARPRTIRSGTDSLVRTPIVSSRDIPAHVQREVARRDGDQCAYVASDGRRCTERSFLEFHHLWTYARGGPATVDNISLRCRRHNQYEADLVFGTRAGRGSKTTPDRSRGAAARVPAAPADPGPARATPA
jgi:5-methylcytosine-specific restriction endonuclease McrA